MGIKRRVDAVTDRVTTRLRQMGVRRFSGSSNTSLATRGVEWIYLIALFLLMAGVINAIGNANSAFNTYPIVPNSTAQNITETFIVLFGYIVGSLGAYALYLSGRQTIRARSAEMFFIGGIALVAVAVTLGYYILYIKGG